MAPVMSGLRSEPPIWCLTTSQIVIYWNVIFQISHFSHMTADNMVETAIDDLPVLSRPRISEEVYAILRARILSQQWTSGQRLDLAQIEESMGISRTPLKEALSRLEMEGLVQIEPRRGTFVTDPTAEQVGEAFDVRRVLDMYAAELAVQRVSKKQLEQLRTLIEELEKLVDDREWNQIYQEYLRLDNEMHAMIVTIAGNKRLLETWRLVNLHSHMASVHYGRTKSDVHVALAHHRTMLRLLEARDAEGLKHTISEHNINSKKWLLSEIAHRPGQGNNDRHPPEDGS